MNKYDDIIHMNHHTSARHPQMSMLARAAQFASFAALTGHNTAIQATASRHEHEIEEEECGIDPSTL